ncbi:hypothetical protein CPB83DRAFT_884035 [Crepidotus variabilis]|uniref:F-box domain-containing protein n=1 Tax=Crepidotus variabilis TaxID=179855 RepID=A0A9P6JNZ5_9AGAR|nr:hypothetical protein CPB83DRAFT_884035 [Crepidotus variabilis]
MYPLKSQSKGLQELPIELLTEILKYTEWCDVLHLRQTCKWVYAVSHEHAIWLALLRHGNNKAEVQPYHSDRPLHLYNAEELESLVLRQHKVFDGWRKPNTFPLLRRTILAPNRSLWCAYPVKGGRWFLVGNRQGDILYFDLDATKATARVLIPFQYSSSARIHLLIAVDMDNDEPFLTFNLAVTALYYASDPEESHKLIQIWRITHKVDDRGRIVDLIAHHSRSFLEEKGIDIASKTYRWYTCIVNWQMTNQTSLSYKRTIIDDQSFDRVAFLPNNWFLCNSFAYLELPEITLPVSQCILPKTLPRRFFGISSIYFSEAFTVRNSERFVFSTTRGVKSIIFPHNNPVDAELVTLYQDRSFFDDGQASFNYAAFISGLELSIRYYTWPDIERYSGDIHLDEESGRIVTSGQDEEYNIMKLDI